MKDVSLVFLFGCYKNTRAALVGGDCAGLWHSICVGWNISDETHTVSVLLTSTSDRDYITWGFTANRGDILHPTDSCISCIVSNISVLLTSFRCVSDMRKKEVRSSAATARWENVFRTGGSSTAAGVQLQRTELFSFGTKTWDVKKSGSQWI